MSRKRPLPWNLIELKANCRFEPHPFLIDKADLTDRHSARESGQTKHVVEPLLVGCPKNSEAVKTFEASDFILGQRRTERFTVGFAFQWMLFGYVTLKDCGKFRIKPFGSGLFDAMSQSCKQNCATSRADPGKVSFLIGSDLANVPQERPTAHHFALPKIGEDCGRTLRGRGSR
jgi:hypothetical protein